MRDDSLDGLVGRHRDEFAEMEPPGSAPTDPLVSTPPSPGTVDATLVEDVSFAQGEPEGPLTDLEKSPARDILDPSSAQSEFTEGPPRRPDDPSVDAFKRNAAEAQRLEEQIAPEETRLEGMSSAEAELEQQIEMLAKEQLLAAYRGWKPVAEGNVPLTVVDAFLIEAGIKRHGNQKIPCSPFMQAIVVRGEIAGTRRFKCKKKRAASYASAVDFAIQTGMTEEEFKGELQHPSTPGERHGIEYLAKRGREKRQAVELKTPQAPAELVEMPFKVEGDLTGIEPGEHLMLVRLQDGAARGAFLIVPETVRHRVLIADAKARRDQPDP